MKELMLGFTDDTMVSFQDRVFAYPEGVTRAATVVIRSKDANSNEEYIVYLGLVDLPLEKMDEFMELGYALLCLLGGTDGVVYIEGNEKEDDD